MSRLPELTRWNEPVWLQPYPDALLDGIRTRPRADARDETREAIALGFVVGLQHLPPQQRAVLVLRDVLGYRAGEVAAMLDISETSVKACGAGRAPRRAAPAGRGDATARRSPAPGSSARSSRASPMRSTTATSTAWWRC